MTNKKIITIVSVIIIGIVGLIVILAILDFLSTEQVTVKSNNPNAEIFVDTLDKPQESKGKGSVSLRLKPGSYNIRITEGNNETRSAFELKKGSPLNIDLPISSAKEPKQFASYAANNIVATSTGISFIWPGYNKLVSLKNGNSVLQQMGNGEYVNAAWVDENHAYIQDAQDVYHYLSDTTLKQLSYTPQAGTLKTASDGKVAYIENGNIFIRPSAFAEPEYKLDTSAIQPEIALGAKNKVLIYDTSIDSEASDQQVAPEIYFGTEKQEKLTNSISKLLIGGASWSPDGSKLAISAADGLYSLDANGNLQLLYKNYITHPQTITWQNENQLIFLLDQTIWQIQLGEFPIWTKLAHINQSVNPTDSFALTKDGSSLYFSSAASQLEGSVYSINLKN